MRAFKTIFQCFLPALIGITAFGVVVGWPILNPKLVSWIYGSDPLKDYMGWAFYRYGPWTFPVGLNPNYGLGISSSILYSDSIPLLAIFFKTVSNLLPGTFQYLGIWTLSCFVLQAWFGYKLSALITQNLAMKIGGCLLFLFVPPFFERIGLHAALVGQFLILWALFLSFRQNGGSTLTAAWSAVICIAALVHMYLLAMVLAIWGAFLLDQVFCKRAIKITAALKASLLTLTCLLLALWQEGLFSADMSTSSINKGDFGFFRMNLLSALDPSGYDTYNWSYLFTLPFVRANGNQEGANYLGLGILFLIPFACIKIASSRARIFHHIKTQAFLLIAVAALAIFSLSNNIGVGSFNYVLPLSDSALQYANLFRASGRFFWPLFYLIIFTILYVVIRAYKPWIASCLIVVAAIIQVADTSAGWSNIRPALLMTHSDSSKNKLQNPFWSEAWRYYRNVELSPVVNNVRQPNWEIFASYANEHKMATNSILLARISGAQVARANDQWMFKAKSNQLDSGTLYILDEANANLILQTANLNQDLLARIDGMNVFAPNWKKCVDCPAVDQASDIKSPIKSPIQIGDVVNFGLLEKGQQYLGAGWPIPEPWGTWSNGPSAKIDLPLPDQQAQVLILNVRALVNGRHPSQNIDILINGKTRTRVQLEQFDKNEVQIPLKSSDWTGQPLHIELLFQNPASPKSLGMGSDDRLMSIGLVSGAYK